MESRPEEIVLPELLSMPPKLLPMVLKFNDYRYFMGEGGRGSGKTHSVASFLLFLAGQQRLRIVCGRETQNSIEESVYTVLKDKIEQFDLYYEVQARKLVHKKTGSTFTFKGFREQGSVSIKGLEGVDILWIDEAQSVTKMTLDTLVPTIRKDSARLFFTMNRFMRDDAVFEFLDGREDCLHIHIDYFENPFCPLATKIEAGEMKKKSQKEYDHIWRGIPLDGASDYLFNYKKLEESTNFKFTGPETSFPAMSMGIDFAAHGDDQCVATLLTRVSHTEWAIGEGGQIPWDEPDAMVSTGRIAALIGDYKPDTAMLDVGGMGHVVYNRLQEVGVRISRFDGASTEGVDKMHYVNARAHGYYMLSDWLDKGILKIHPSNKQLLKELKKVRMKFRSDGRRLLQAKVDMKKELGFSPDYADSAMMAVWGAVQNLGSFASPHTVDINKNSVLRRKVKSDRVSNRRR